MIKKIFSSKLFYLILLFILNISVLICVCIITIKPLDSGTEYFPSGEDKILPTTSSRYLIQEKNFITYESYYAEIINEEEIYSTYKLNEKVIQVGTEIKKDDIIGSYNGNSVYSLFDSFCLDVVECENGYEVITYNYNKFLVEISMGNYDYQHVSFDTTEIYLNHNGNYYGLNFVGYDYSFFQSSNIIKAVFSPKDCNALINSNSNCTFEIKKDEYKNQLCVSAELFDYQTYHKSFYVIVDNVITLIYVESFEIVDNYALIQSSDLKLEKGMYLYLYE